MPGNDRLVMANGSQCFNKGSPVFYSLMWLSLAWVIDMMDKEV